MGEDEEKLESWYIIGGTVKPLTWKIVWQFLQELNIRLAYDSIFPYLVVYSRILQLYVNTKTGR